MAKALAVAIGGTALMVGWAQQSVAAPPPMPLQALTQVREDVGQPCKEDNPREVVVCGRLQQRYRIDPDVLASARAGEASPAKPPLDAASAGGCIGPNCGGGTIPLVGMALTLIKAAELASRGDDWREAFRMNPDQYQAYRQSEATKKDGVGVAVRAGNNWPPGQQ